MSTEPTTRGAEAAPNAPKSCESLHDLVRAWVQRTVPCAVCGRTSHTVECELWAGHQARLASCSQRSWTLWEGSTEVGTIKFMPTGVITGDHDALLNLNLDVQ